MLDARRFYTWLVVLGLVAVTVQGIWLKVFLARCETQGPLYELLLDTSLYKQNAESLFTNRPMVPVYRERILLPLLIAASHVVSDSDSAVLWFVLPFHFAAVFSIGYIAWTLSGKRMVGLFGAALYLCYPNAYFHGVRIGTDILHAQLAVTAVAATVAWTRTGKGWVGLAASCAWPLAQITRPTLFPVAVALPFLLWADFRRKGGLVPAMAILAASALIPATFTFCNWMDYGVATPSLAGIENMHRYIVPSLKVVQRDSEKSDALQKDLWHQARDIEAGGDPRYQALRLYEPEHVPEGFSDNYRALMREDRAYVREHAGWLKDVFWATYDNVMLTPPSNPFRNDASPLGGGFERLLGMGLKAATIFAIFGLAIGWRNGRYSLVLFAGAFLGIVLGPALFIWWVGDRVRLPADLLMLSFIAVALVDEIALCGFAAIVLAGYVPCHVLHLPIAYFYGVTGLTLIAGTSLILRQRKRIAL